MTAYSATSAMTVIVRIVDAKGRVLGEGPAKLRRVTGTLIFRNPRDCAVEITRGGFPHHVELLCPETYTPLVPCKLATAPTPLYLNAADTMNFPVSCLSFVVESRL